MKNKRGSLKQIGSGLFLILVVLPSIITTLIYLPQLTSGDINESANILAEYIEKMIMPWWVRPLMWADERPGTLAILVIITIASIIYLIYYATGELH